MKHSTANFTIFLFAKYITSKRSNASAKNTPHDCTQCENISESTRIVEILINQDGRDGCFSPEASHFMSTGIFYALSRYSCVHGLDVSGEEAPPPQRILRQRTFKAAYSCVCENVRFVFE